VRSVLNKHGMTNPELFGSVARGDDQPGSDVDILVDFPKGVSLFGIAKAQAELEGILGAPVDLVPRSSLKPLIRDHIQADLIPL
jgi:predicted nucleotidyltransferase